MACLVCVRGLPEQQPIDDLQQSRYAGVTAVIAVEDGVAHTAVAVDVA
jgi:hypothetical protein